MACTTDLLLSQAQWARPGSDACSFSLQHEETSTTATIDSRQTKLTVKNTKKAHRPFWWIVWTFPELHRQYNWSAFLPRFEPLLQAVLVNKSKAQHNRMPSAQQGRSAEVTCTQGTPSGSKPDGAVQVAEAASARPAFKQASAYGVLYLAVTHLSMIEVLHACSFASHEGKPEAHLLVLPAAVD